MKRKKKRTVRPNELFTLVQVVVVDKRNKLIHIFYSTVRGKKNYSHRVDLAYQR